MQNFQWEMMAQFIFPSHFGTVEEVISVDIKPRWQEIETGDSIRLAGIYHIMAVVRFNPSQTPRFSEGTFIEHIELDGNNGYFEYAIPFEVDLPREKLQPTDHPKVDIRDLSFFIFDGSNCLFKWEACCVLSEQADEQLLEQDIPSDSISVVEEVEETIQNTSTELPKQADNEPTVEVSDEQPSYESVLQKAEQQEVPQLELEAQSNIEEQVDTLNYLESIHLPTYNENVDAQATLEQQERIVETKPVVEQEQNQLAEDENVVIVEDSEEDEKTSYLPTDTDDFYNQLTESYTVLKLSNNIIRE